MRPKFGYLDLLLALTMGAAATILMVESIPLEEHPEYLEGFKLGVQNCLAPQEPRPANTSRAPKAQ